MAKKKTKKKATKKKAGGGGEPLVVASKAKAYLKSKGCNVAGDALDGLNNVVYWYLDQAASRADANNRKTVRAHDFLSM